MTSPEGPEAPLADLLRERTRPLHRQAERSGIVSEALRGRASRRGYALLLRNLLPAYRELEAGLERHRRDPALRAIARPPVYRSRALASDLRALGGPGWEEELPVLRSGRGYAERIAEVSDGAGFRLVAHAYTRFLADLNGGRALKRALARSLGLGPEALSFYEYPGIDDLKSFRRAYRGAFDGAARIVDREAVAEEAERAFRFNIAISLEVQHLASGRGPAPQACG